MVWDAAGGHPAGPSDVPTARLYAAWKTERQDAAAVAELYGVSRADVLEADLAARHRPDLAIVDLLFGGHETRACRLNLARRLRQDGQAPSLLMAADAGPLGASKRASAVSKSR